MEKKYFNSIDEYVDKVKHFKIPYDIRMEVYLLRLLKDPEYWIDNYSLDKIKIKYPDFSIIDKSIIKKYIWQKLKLEGFVEGKMIKVEYKNLASDEYQCDFLWKYLGWFCPM